MPILRCPFRLVWTSANDREASYQRIIDFQQAQILALYRIVKDQLGSTPLPLTNDERRTIAERAKAIGWNAIKPLVGIVSIGSLRRWFRDLVVAQPSAKKASTKHTPGRPPISTRTRRLVIRIARHNPTWGHDKIAGVLANLRISISDRAVGGILKDHGIPNAPERSRRSVAWKAFLAAHWKGLAAIDGFTVPVLVLQGLKLVWKPCTVLICIHYATRRICCAGVNLHPDSSVMTSIARSLAMDDGFLHRVGATHLVHDGDGAFLKTGFIDVLNQRGVTCLQIPTGAPNCNPYAERVIQSIQRECTDRIHFIGDRGLRAAIDTYVDYYHRRRNHQGIGNALIEPAPEFDRTGEKIISRVWLGGILRSYERTAA